MVRKENGKMEYNAGINLIIEMRQRYDYTHPVMVSLQSYFLMSYNRTNVYVCSSFPLKKRIYFVPKWTEQKKTAKQGA